MIKYYLDEEVALIIDTIKTQLAEKDNIIASLYLKINALEEALQLHRNKKLEDANVILEFKELNAK